MSYATQSFYATQSLSVPTLSGVASSVPSTLGTAVTQSLFYCQRDSLMNCLLFLSRSLNRMRIAHAFMGGSAIALHDTTDSTSKERTQEIELLMSPESYHQFCQTWVHQRLVTIEGEDRQFWDNRTGYLLRVFLTGDWVKTGKRAFQAPDPNQLPKTEDDIAYWSFDPGDRHLDRSSDRPVKPALDDRRTLDYPNSQPIAA